VIHLNGGITEPTVADGNWLIVLSGPLSGKRLDWSNEGGFAPFDASGTLIGIAFTSIRLRITSFPVKGEDVLLTGARDTVSSLFGRSSAGTHVPSRDR
jgi:hypothetical protein